VAVEEDEHAEGAQCGSDGGGPGRGRWLAGGATASRSVGEKRGGSPDSWTSRKEEQIRKKKKRKEEQAAQAPAADLRMVRARGSTSGAASRMANGWSSGRVSDGEKTRPRREKS
jgi:hypothetical protein